MARRCCCDTNILHSAIISSKPGYIINGIKGCLDIIS